ncbi:MAG: bifunctional diaminohydroxyphosphoribosylaminopyrimidine deaminase/5-amino-6-(5-phosphoribosylamino)uracil reductase RibD [Gammaproteobacteria bacterium]|nr:bifunctional diaminohydroxyphosphoribosylaminopyrimidine deaminase/5-amino-6-(5-phosphoribosylamino)uracil reductase RibD [Gammaproteobacteria bacterium]
MITGADRAHLAEAIELAGRGLYTTTPNPRVGCVIAQGERVLGRGWHQWAGQGHAEVRALEDAGQDAAGATAYVSLEPCSIHGRTPPCADALVAAGIKRVVVGALDPDPRVNGKGLEQLKAAGIEVDLANDERAQALNLGHRQRMVRARPWVRVKMAASLDGRTAMASGESQWITGPEARLDVQHWRARSCAVVTGIGTLLADDPRLNVRDDRFASDGTLRQPLRVVTDSQLRSPAEAQIFQPPGAALIAHAGAATAAHPKAECLPCGTEQVDLAQLLTCLADRECNEVLVEAGPTLAGAFLAAGLCDELVLYLAPKLLGAKARPLLGLALERLEQALAGEIVEVERFGPDLRLRLTGF